MKKDFYRIMVLLLLVTTGCKDDIDSKPMTPEIKVANQVWKKLLKAMKNRDEATIKQNTTESGWDSLIQFIEEEPHLDMIESYGKVFYELQELGTHWKESEKSNQIYLLIGTDRVPHGFEFKNTSDGWKLNEWLPGH